MPLCPAAWVPVQALQCLVSTLRSLVDWYTHAQALEAAQQPQPQQQHLPLPQLQHSPTEPLPQQDWGMLTSQSTGDSATPPDAPGTPPSLALPSDCAPAWAGS